jgi:ubiquinol-cytochrome c reductase cytochrome b subunit
MLQFLTTAWQTLDDRLGIKKNLLPLMHHPVPPRTGWWYVFGSATLFTFILQVVTGTVLATIYVPSTAHAYDSIVFITKTAFLGHLVRGLHFWGGSAMILFIGIHSIRVYLMGSYKYPREANWLTGAVLMVLVLGMGFSGQLLPWDQNAIWSVIVGAEQAAKVPIVGRALARWILGGETLGGLTLSRFYAAHVFFFPGLIFLVLGLHLYLVIHNGISEPPKAGRPVDPKHYRAWYEHMIKTEGVPFWPDVAWRDVMFGFSIMATIFLLAWLVGPPQLQKVPDPTIIKASPQPYWYFLWFFSVLAMSPHAGETFLIIATPSVFFIVMFLLPFIAHKGERSPKRRPWAIALVIMSVIIIGVFWRKAETHPWVPDFTAQYLPQTVVASSDPAVVRGALLFHERGCEYCHYISGYGGHRGPDLTDIGDRLTRQQMTLFIMNGGYNMPPFAGVLKSDETDDLLAFLRSRTASAATQALERTKQ